MAAYFAKRLLLIIPTFIGITFVLFLITRLVPGGPIEEAINAHLFSPSRGAEGGGPPARPPPQRREAAGPRPAARARRTSATSSWPG
jgi:microcin C transport system permease protein